MSAGSRLASLFRRRESGVALALALLVLVLSVAQHEFRSGQNLYLVSRQIAFVAIAALGVFGVILTGGIDLSIGSMVSLGGVVTGLALAHGLPVPLALGCGLAAGALVGTVNGLLVAQVKVTPFIVTLGMMSVARGLVLVLTHGDSVRGLPPALLKLLSADVGGVPVPVVVLVVMAVAAQVVLSRTGFGRAVYAVGGNEPAAALSGIRTQRVKLAVYVVASLCSTVTGILYLGRFNSAQANAGMGLELDAIAAAVIGGTSLMGGEGSVLGVILGATIMGVVRNGLVLVRVSSYWQELIIGVIIVLAAVIDVVRSKRR